MSAYLKFGEKRMKIEEIEKHVLSGSLEASKCLGNYYSKRRKTNYDFYPLCIDYYKYCANKGCIESMVKVSKYSFEYAKIIDQDKMDLKFLYIALSTEYAYKAFYNANTKPLRKSALDCLMYSSLLVDENIDLLKSYIKDIEQ